LTQAAGAGPHAGMGGHLFVIHGDITRLACDAWLVPGDVRGIGPAWRTCVAAHQPPEGFDPDKHARRVWRWAPKTEGDPIPYHCVLGSRGKTVEWYVEGARQFLARVNADFAPPETPRHRRARPLVALPLVGTGSGGAKKRTGAVAEALLTMLYEQVPRLSVDVALVLNEALPFAACQEVRRRRFADRAWRALGDHRAEATALGKRARRGGLVLFIGAGVSVSAGLPLWSELLLQLAEGVIEDAERPAFMDLDLLDQAAVLDRRLREDDDGGATLRRRIGERMRAAHYGLSHGLLAGLPVGQVVTTNYDTLFEAASTAAQQPPAVLPYETVSAPHQRWLLKLHGSVDADEDDIVLSRSDYQAYQDRRQALRGIVQTMLITRHMLFVGFSLKDPNFQGIVHAVRKATGREAAFGTALLLGSNPLQADLWPDLKCLELGAADEGIAESARRQEIFLDQLAAEAVDNSRHLLDEHYATLLDTREKGLKARLNRFIAGVPRQERTGEAWRAVARTLERLGWRR
jgi:hypothetical protein